VQPGAPHRQPQGPGVLPVRAALPPHLPGHAQGQPQAVRQAHCQARDG